MHTPLESKKKKLKKAKKVSKAGNNAEAKQIMDSQEEVTEVSTPAAEIEPQKEDYSYPATEETKMEEPQQIEAAELSTMTSNEAEQETIQEEAPSTDNHDIGLHS